MTEKKRIEFIDLAKGVCITLVVLSHCKVNLPYLNYIRMPLYFILSGLFFKTYSGFGNFTLRKINKILIPFLFFYVVSFLIYIAISMTFPDIKINTEVDKFYFEDPLYSRLCINNPLWFLLSLFTVNVAFYAIFKLTSHNWIRMMIAIGLAVGAYFVDRYNVSLPIYLYKSMFYSLFFFVGYFLKQTDLLIENPDKKHCDWLLICGLLLCFFGLKSIRFFPIINPIKYYIIAISGVLALLLMLKKIKRIPYISFFGRYSIIILCTSYWIYSPLSYVMHKVCSMTPLSVEMGKLVVFLITMIMEYFIIKLCIKYLPHVTAQKDIIPVESKE